MPRTKPIADRKAKEKSLEQRLFKLLEKGQAPAGPMITSPKLFVHIEQFVQFYLTAGAYSQQFREHAAHFAFAMREAAIERFHHDTIETFRLASLLRQSAKPSSKPQIDVITHIMENPDKALRFSAEQLSAAEHIQKIWQAFGKGLSMAARDLAKIGKSGQVLHPLDTMGEDTWEGYKTYFQPWYRITNNISVKGLKTGSYLSLAGLVYRALVEDIYPELLDVSYAFPEGLALKTLHVGLSHYWEPKNLANAFARMNKPQERE